MGFSQSLREGARGAWSLVPKGTAAAPLELAASVPLSLSRTAAWAQLSDLSVAHCYVPGLIDTLLVSAQAQGVGSHRYVFQASGDYLEETVIDWCEGEGFTLKLHYGERPLPPFVRAEFRYQLADDGAGSAMQLAMILQMPWGARGRAMAQKHIVPVVMEQLVQIGAGIKHFYETGEPASDADRQRLAGAVSAIAPAG